MSAPNKIRRARELAELTQVELAAKVGWDQGRISEIETKPSENLPLKTLRKFAEFFGMPIEDLFPRPEDSAR